MKKIISIMAILIVMLGYCNAQDVPTETHAKGIVVITTGGSSFPETRSAKNSQLVRRALKAPRAFPGISKRPKAVAKTNFKVLQIKIPDASSSAAAGSRSLYKPPVGITVPKLEMRQNKKRRTNSADVNAAP